MEIIEKRIEELIPYENNPRKNDGAVEAVANSIKEFGFKVPIIVDSENVIVAGHTRLRAAEELGLDTVPVIRADDLNEEQIRAFRLADNKTSELAGWDFTRLEEELNLLDDFDMEQFGFEALASGADDDDAISSETSFTYTEQYGVIVMCADEAEQETIYNKLTDEGYNCKVVAV